MKQTSKVGYETVASITLIAILLITSVYVPIQTVSADGCYEYEVFLCDECPYEEGIEIRPLSRDELNIAVSEALRNGDVKTLRDALIKDGYTPMVDNSSAGQVIDDETGEINGLIVTIPFRGDGIYSAVYYFHCYLEDYEKAAAGTAYESGDQVNMNVYKINEEGEVIIIELHDHSCTFNCVMNCCISWGMNPISAASCVASCIICYSSGWPACIICAACSGIVVGCTYRCCG